MENTLTPDSNADELSAGTATSVYGYHSATVMNFQKRIGDRSSNQKQQMYYIIYFLTWIHYETNNFVCLHLFRRTVNVCFCKICKEINLQYTENKTNIIKEKKDLIFLICLSTVKHQIYWKWT